MTIHKAAELISLTLTVPTVILGMLVVVIWGKSGISALRKRNRTGTDWLVLGIIVSFIGAGLDNVYWGLAWGSDFLGHKASADLFRHGVYANIPFRQTAGIIASLCHIRGAVSWSMREGFERKSINRIVSGTWLLCGLVAIALYSCI